MTRPFSPRLHRLLRVMFAAAFLLLMCAYGLAKGDYPPGLDPYDPKVSRAERIRRAQELMRRQFDAAKRKKEEEAQAKKQQREGDQRPPARPPMPPPGPMPGMLPGMPGVPPTDVSKTARNPHTTFFMTPGSQMAYVGQEVATQCVLLNPDHMMVTSIQINLSYPPAVVEPVKIHQGLLVDRIEGEPQTSLDKAKGELRYRATFKEPTNIVEILLITIEWKALAPSQRVRIQPWIGQDYSGSWLGKQWQTTAEVANEEAVAGARLRIIEPGTSLGEQFLTSSQQQIANYLSDMPSQTDLNRPVLWIDQPAERTFEAEEWVVVDVGLDNPDHCQFNEIKLALSYDPAAVEILDTDQGNLIDKGVNALDGVFKKEWSWDQHWANQVDNEQGLFFYHMGASSPQFRQGPVCRLFLHIKKQTSAPLLRWVWAGEPSGSRPTTGLYLLGHNLYMPDSDKNFDDPDQILRAMDVQPPLKSYEKADPSAYRF